MNSYIKIMLIFILLFSITKAQINYETTEPLICGIEEITSAAILAIGDFYELVIPVGFIDRLNAGGTLDWPTLVNNADYPKHGVFPNDTLLSQYISIQGGAIPLEDWYEPMLDIFFDTHSKRYNASGYHTVDFDFIKKSDGTPYTPDSSMAYWISQNGASSNVIWNKYQEILTDVVDNIYSDNPNVINNADAIHFVFAVGSTSQGEFHVENDGTAISKIVPFNSWL